MAWLLNSEDITTIYGIRAGHAPGSNTALQGCFDLPVRIGDTYHSWDEENTVEPFVDTDEIFFSGRDITFHGHIAGTRSTVDAYLKAFYTTIGAFTGLVTFSTPYGDFSVQVKKVTSSMANGACSVVIIFREPIVTLSGGTLPAEASDSYMIDGIPMSSFGLYISKAEDLYDLPEIKEEYFTKYESEGYQIVKHKHNILTLNGFISATNLADFQAKIKNLYLLFSQAGLRDVVFGGSHIVCFAVEGFKVEDVLFTPTVGTVPVFVSATVENAAPTKVILTYDQTLDGASVPATGDFTVTDHTISGVEINGSTVELTLSAAVIFFDILNVTYTKGANPIQGDVGEMDAADLSSTLITNNVARLGTEIDWWLASDLSKITKDGSDFVSSWKGKINNTDLPQANGTNQPKWGSDGITGDGVDNFLKNSSLTWAQPEYIIMVVKPITNTVGDAYFDGKTANSGKLSINVAGSWLNLTADTGFNINAGIVAGDWYIFRILINGASSKVIKNTTTYTGTVRAGAMNGLTLFANASPGGYHNCTIKEVIGFTAEPDAAYVTALYNTVKARSGV